MTFTAKAQRAQRTDFLFFPTTFYRNSQDLEKYVAENYEAFSKIISDMGMAK